MIRTTSIASALLGLALLGSIPSFAHDTHTGTDQTEVIHTAEIIHIGDLEITGAFTRATLPNQPVGGGYLTITNTGETDDTLIGGNANFAGHVEVHEMSVVNDVMSMRQLADGLSIPAGETVTLQPGGFHLMFMQMHEPLVAGETVTVTLDFANAGPAEINFVVAPAGAREMPDSEHSGHDDHGAVATPSH